jgi:6,7-dimethyl-8-ribityllumazine synthase
MPQVFQGDSGAISGRFAIVVARYNANITQKLLDGALQTLQASGIPSDSIDIAWVPGAWEIPLIAQDMALCGKYVAVLCFGAVIKGDTTHDEHINRFVSLSLGELGLKTNLPVLFGVLTCNNLEQAIHRAGGNVGNKGCECAEAALELLRLRSRLSQH